MDQLVAVEDSGGSLGQLIWILTPILTMIIFRSFTQDGWQDFGFRLRGNGALYAISLLFYPVLASVVVFIGMSAGWLEGTLLSSAFIAAVLASLIPSFVKNICEEFAWRGYLAPRCFTLGYPRLLVHLYAGLIWGAWHFPYLYKYIETTESMVTFIPRFMIGVIAMAIVYGEIRWRTKSVWPAVIMHTAGNAFVDTMILKKYVLVHESANAFAAPSPEGWIVILLTAAAGWAIYRWRHA